MKKQTMSSPRKTIPTPADLLAKADTVSEGINLADYRPVMSKLRDKGMPFRAVAAWLSNELGRPITHTMVFRLMREEIPAGVENVTGEELLAREFREEDEQEEKKGKK